MKAVLPKPKNIFLNPTKKPLSALPKEKIEKNGQLKTVEIKWNPKVKVRLSKAFSNKYHNNTFTDINSDNFFEYLMGTLVLR
jgi:hypothetical protein